MKLNRLLTASLLGFSLITTTSAFACDHASSNSSQESHWSFFGWCHHDDSNHDCDHHDGGNDCDHHNGGGDCNHGGSSSGGSSTGGSSTGGSTTGGSTGGTSSGKGNF